MFLHYINRQKSLNSIISIVLLFSIISSCEDSKKDKTASTSKLTFVDITESANLSYNVNNDEVVGDYDEEAGGVAVYDIDGDGYLDFFVTHGLKGKARLFKNLGNGKFEDITDLSNIVTSTKASGALFVDIDSDGINDLLITQAPDATSSDNFLVYKNQGNGTFIDVTATSTLKPQSDLLRSIAAADFDRDNDLDIAIAPHGFRPVVNENHDYLWENTGNGYIDVTQILPVPDHNYALNPEQANSIQWGFTPAFSDVNDDGFLDLLYASGYDNSQIFLNQSGSFFETHEDVFTDEAGMGAAIGDYDNDGDFDWFVSSVWHPDKSWNPFGEGNSGNRLYQNDGTGLFRDATDAAGVRKGFFGWGACFGDFDLDGDLDLFHVNGLGGRETWPGELYSYFKEDPAVFFLNQGDGTFIERATDFGLTHSGQGRGISCWDYDNDGDLDILIGNNAASPNLYRNDLVSSNNFLKVRLEGYEGNRRGVGAKLTLLADGKTQIREIRLGSNYLSNNPVIAHFGLGKSKKVDLLTIRWPDARQTITQLKDIEANQFISVKF